VAEQLLFESDGVRISSALAQFEGDTYQIANIASVRIVRRRKAHPIAITILAVGLVFLAAAFAAHQTESAPAIRARSGEIALTGLGIVLAAGLFQLVWPRRRYVLMLKRRAVTFRLTPPAGATARNVSSRRWSRRSSRGKRGSSCGTGPVAASWKMKEKRRQFPRRSREEPRPASGSATRAPYESESPVGSL